MRHILQDPKKKDVFSTHEHRAETNAATLEAAAPDRRFAGRITADSVFAALINRNDENIMQKKAGSK